MSDYDFYTEKLEEKVKSLTYKQKIELLVEKELLDEDELNDLIYNNYNIKEIEDVCGD